VNAIYQFKIKGLEDNDINFARFKGKKILIVNVASECGFTPQYQQLQELYDHFKDLLIIVGIPSNDFGGQEPGSNEEIRLFCTSRYQVSFPMAAKIRIKGPDPSPLYQWLTQKSLNGVADSEVQWNFYKYLIDEEGRLVGHYPSTTSPLDDKIIDWVNS
jgi:glutathione peroxidase